MSRQLCVQRVSARAKTVRPSTIGEPCVSFWICAGLRWAQGPCGGRGVAARHVAALLRIVRPLRQAVERRRQGVHGLALWPPERGASLPAASTCCSCCNLANLVDYNVGIFAVLAVNRTFRHKQHSWPWCCNASLLLRSACTCTRVRVCTAFARSLASIKASSRNSTQRVHR